MNLHVFDYAMLGLWFVFMTILAVKRPAGGGV